MNDSDLDAGVVSAFKSLLDDQISSGIGMSKFAEAVVLLCEKNGLEWFLSGTKEEFTARCQFLFQSYSDDLYGQRRRQELIDGDFALWVFRAEHECPDDHLELDGLTLAPGHPFWDAGYPPLEPGCGCFVLGASSNRAAARLGGKPDKVAPVDFPYPTRESDIEILLGMIRNGTAPIDTGI